jgi:hypothetical protein
MVAILALHALHIESITIEAVAWGGYCTTRKKAPPLVFGHFVPSILLPTLHRN